LDRVLRDQNHVIHRQPGARTEIVRIVLLKAPPGHAVSAENSARESARPRAIQPERSARHPEPEKTNTQQSRPIEPLAPQFKLSGQQLVSDPAARHMLSTAMAVNQLSAINPASNALAGSSFVSSPAPRQPSPSDIAALARRAGSQVQELAAKLAKLP
jgi:hypothetical protein